MVRPGEAWCPPFVLADGRAWCPAFAAGFLKEAAACLIATAVGYPLAHTNARLLAFRRLCAAAPSKKHRGLAPSPSLQDTVDRVLARAQRVLSSAL